MLTWGCLIYAFKFFSPVISVLSEYNYVSVSIMRKGVFVSCVLTITDTLETHWSSGRRDGEGVCMCVREGVPNFRPIFSSIFLCNFDKTEHFTLKRREEKRTENQQIRLSH